MTREKNERRNLSKKSLPLILIYFRAILAFGAAFVFALVGSTYFLSELTVGHSPDLGMILLFELILLLFSALLAFLGYFWFSESINK